MNQENRASNLSPEEILDSIRGAMSRDESSAPSRPQEPGRATSFVVTPPPAPIERAQDDPIPTLKPAEEAAPLVADQARTSIGESFATLSKVARLDGISEVESARENRMNAISAATPSRPLSEIEKDLIAAEAQFSDAEARRKQAENDARVALDGINKYQAEIDAAIDRLRQISPAGSNWSRLVQRSSNVLTLKDELPNDPVVRANFHYSTKT